MMHWVQDSECIAYTPSINGNNQASLLTALTVVGERADVRKQLKERLDVEAKEASPGPLLSENKWRDWEPKFTNYLSTIIGMNCVPLS